MKRLFLLIPFGLLAGCLHGQDKMTAGLLWKLGRVNPETVTPAGEVIFGVTRYHIQQNTGESDLYAVPLAGGSAARLTAGAGSGGGVQVLQNGKLGYTYE
jgi:hypothetical protein